MCACVCVQRVCACVARACVCVCVGCGVLKEGVVCGDEGGERWEGGRTEGGTDEGERVGARWMGVGIVWCVCARVCSMPLRVYAVRRVRGVNVYVCACVRVRERVRVREHRDREERKRKVGVARRSRVCARAPSRVCRPPRRVELCPALVLKACEQAPPRRLPADRGCAAMWGTIVERTDGVYAACETMRAPAGSRSCTPPATHTAALCATRTAS